MKKGVSNSAKIRSLREKNPGLTVAEIVAQMEKDGNPVSASHVYQALKAKKAAKTKGRKRGSKPGAAAATTTGAKRGPKPGSVRVKAAATATTDQDLFAATQTFVNAAGSLDKAIEILNVFKR